MRKFVTQQNAYRFRKAHFQHFETHLSEKLKTALWKIPLTFLFDRRHFNHVSAEALVLQGGHPVMRSEWAKLEFIP